jgi:hypothetical protein
VNFYLSTPQFPGRGIWFSTVGKQQAAICLTILVRRLDSFCLSRLSSDKRRTVGILHALIAASYTEPPEGVQEKCFKFATHPGEAALRGAAIVLGSIAFVHGPIDFLRSVATLIKDASVAGMPSPGVCMRIVTDTHQ